MTKRGRPKGALNYEKRGAAKKSELVLKTLVNEVNREKKPMIKALIESAKGIWVEMKLPGQKGKVMVYKKEPNILAGKELLTQVLGRPVERQELSGPGGGPIVVKDDTKKMSNEELTEGIRKLLSK